MNMNSSKRYLWGGGVLSVIAIGLMVGVIRPYKHASAALPGTVPDDEVLRDQQQDVPIVHEWIGTFDGLVNAGVRAQVTGYLLKQGYEEGAFVKKGQLLFHIDPRPFQAVLDQAGGQLARPKPSLPTPKPCKAAQSLTSRGTLLWPKSRLPPNKISTTQFKTIWPPSPAWKLPKPRSRLRRPPSKRRESTSISPDSSRRSMALQARHNSKWVLS